MKKFPDIEDLPEYEDRMTKWWNKLVKGLEQGDNNKALYPVRKSSPSEKWSNLRLGGHNGLQTVLFGLAFWKTHLRAQAIVSDSIQRLTGLCEDVQWVIKDMAMKLREELKNKKRNLDNASDDLSSKKLKVVQST